MDPGCYFLGDIGCLNDNLEKLVKIIGSKIRLGEKIFLLGDNFYNHESEQLMTRCGNYIKISLSQ